MEKSEKIVAEIEAMRNGIRKELFRTETNGAYHLKTIFNDARRNGVVRPGSYDCILRTSNGAHWTGYRFIASVNYYIEKDNHTHKFHNIVDVRASISGCSGGVRNLSVEGKFKFERGDCNQSIFLVCTTFE